MKKLIGTIALLAMSMTSMNAQENGLYLSLNGGYNFAAGTEKGTVSNVTSVSTSSSNVTTSENIALSYGKGLNVGGAIGYMFNKNVGAELAFDYLIGGKTSGNETTTSAGGVDKTDIDFSAKMLQIVPSLVIAAGMEGINPYAKFGLVIGSSKLTENTTDVDTSGGTTDTTEFTKETETNTGFGFKGAVGAMFTVNPNISIFAELTSVNMSQSLKSSSITKATVNGVDVLAGGTIFQKETVYEDTLTTTSPTPATPNAPRKAVTTTVPFSSFGINVGLKYSF